MHGRKISGTITGYYHTGNAVKCKGAVEQKVASNSLSDTSP
jgi:hypothetical protein